MSGEITSLESRLRHLRCSLVHVDATLRLFAPDADPEEIRAKKPYRRTKLFGAGKLNRLILGALRRGERPMTTAEVVDSIVAELGYGEDAAAGMRNRVRASLQYLWRMSGTVVRQGSGRARRWGWRKGLDQTNQMNLIPTTGVHQRQAARDLEMIALLRAKIANWLGLNSRPTIKHSTKIVNETARERERLSRIVKDTNSLVEESRRALEQV